MKLIIDIPESEYMEIKRYYDNLPMYSTVEAELYYIAHGTPLYNNYTVSNEFVDYQDRVGADMRGKNMAGDRMIFPDTFDEFVNTYGFFDDEEVYTNGRQLIPVFRVKQWLEHVSVKTQMIDKSNFDEEQYKIDLKSAYECGYNQACKDKIVSPYEAERGE